MENINITTNQNLQHLADALNNTQSLYYLEDTPKHTDKSANCMEMLINLTKLSILYETPEHAVIRDNDGIFSVLPIIKQKFSETDSNNSTIIYYEEQSYASSDIKTITMNILKERKVNK